MKVFVLSTVFGLASGLTLQQTNPKNVKLGEQIGAILSKGLSQDPIGFEKAFEKSVEATSGLNTDAIKAFSKKFSFVNLPNLNLHVLESPADDSADALTRAQVHALEQLGKNSFLTLKNIDTLAGRLDTGSYPAHFALEHMLNLVADSNARNALVVKGLGRNLANLMEKESTSDENRNLAGSLLTRLSGGPVASEVSDSEGSSGHVNVVVPRPSRVYGNEAAALAVKAGASRLDVPSQQ